MKAILSEHILARKKIEAEYFGMTDAAAEAKKETEVMAGAVSKAAGGFCKYPGIMAPSPACLTGLSPGVRKAVNDFAEPEEPEADVMKYTGMSRKEVKDPGEDPGKDAIMFGLFNFSEWE